VGLGPAREHLDRFQKGKRSKKTTSMFSGWILNDKNAFCCVDPLMTSSRITSITRAPLGKPSIEAKRCERGLARHRDRFGYAGFG